MFTQVSIRNYVCKHKHVISLCRGKRVLHLGCVGFTDCEVAEKVRLARHSLHQQLSDIATCVGVDLDAASIHELQERGVFSNVLVGNVEALEQLPQSLAPFDVVVAGDIIEHVSNPGKMLDGIHRWLKPDGCVVISTPNSMGLPAFLRYVRGRFHEGLQHVLCFNPITLAQLLNRHGYQVREALTCHQGQAARQHGWKFALGRAGLRRFPKLGGTLLFVAIPVAKPLP